LKERLVKILELNLQDILGISLFAILSTVLIKKRISLIILLLSFTGMKFAFGGFVSTFGASAAVVLTPLIDNFEDGVDPNLWGGMYAPMNSGVGVSSGSIAITYDSTQYKGASGYSMRINYNVPHTADWTGMQIGLAPMDGSRNVSAYRYLTFDIKGLTAGQSFRIEFQSASGTQSHIYLTDYLDGGASTSWQNVQIPLDAFANFASISAITDLKYINFVFEHDYLSTSTFPTSGTINIDNIGFGSAQPSLVRIDHFGDKWGLNALGGNMGGMGNDTAHSATIAFDNINYMGTGIPFGLRVNYNVPTGNWAGCYFLVGGWTTGAVAMPHDFSAYNYLNLSCAGAAGIKPPYRFKVELQYNNNGTTD